MTSAGGGGIGGIGIDVGGGPDGNKCDGGGCYKTNYFSMKKKKIYIYKHTVQGGGGPLDPDVEGREPEKCGNAGRED